jgi:hypothetical protein
MKPVCFKVELYFGISSDNPNAGGRSSTNKIPKKSKLTGFNDRVT